MRNPQPITQHGLKMFLVLLFSCVVEIENVIENPKARPAIYDYMFIFFFSQRKGGKRKFITVKTLEVFHHCMR